MAITTDTDPDRGWIGSRPKVETYDTIVVGDTVHRVYKVLVHRFKITNAEDPYLYAAHPLWEWQESEIGKWVMSHAVESPVWHRMHDHISYYYEFAVVAKFKEKDYTHWLIKWKKLSE